MKTDVIALSQDLIHAPVFDAKFLCLRIRLSIVIKNLHIEALGTRHHCLTYPTKSNNSQSFPSNIRAKKHLRSPDRDEVWARRLFERAVGGFCQVVLAPEGWNVRTGRKLDWQLDWTSEGMLDVLPGMTTDIILENPSNDRRIVIDTKFTSLIKPGRFGSTSLSSAYLYQIYAYLKSQTGKGGLNDVAEGLMLHPSVGEKIDVSASIQGQKVRFATIDLSGDSVGIREQLRSTLVSE